MKLSIERQSLPFTEPFRISGQTYDTADIVVVTASKDGYTGVGEAAGVDYRGDTIEHMLAAFELVVPAAAAGELDRDTLQDMLPPGGTRNAIDCALWDLEAKTTDVPAAWEAGFALLSPLDTVVTLGIDTPERMAAKAVSLGRMTKLKIKLGEPGDLERLRAVRNAAPAASLIVDANQGWSLDTLCALLPELERLGVQLIEQPLPVAQDEALRGVTSAVPICADESCQDRADLPSLRGKYQAVNIKLDKAGGLTESLALLAAARAEGYLVMVGCMGGSSRCIAPAFLVGQRCDFIDLDCPLQLQRDVTNAMRYVGNTLFPYHRALWG